MLFLSFWQSKRGRKKKGPKKTTVQEKDGTNSDLSDKRELNVSGSVEREFCSALLMFGIQQRNPFENKKRCAGSEGKGGGKQTNWSDS